MHIIPDIYIYLYLYVVHIIFTYNYIIYTLSHVSDALHLKSSLGMLGPLASATGLSSMGGRGAAVALGCS